MGLFKKNKFKVHVEEEEKKQEAPVETIASKIFFLQVLEDEDATKSIDVLKDGRPVCLNFERLEVSQANKILAFMAGATYVLGGETYELNERSYLFVTEKNLEDGSISKWLKDYHNEVLRWTY